jgi:hypothetical protein
MLVNKGTVESLNTCNLKAFLDAHICRDITCRDCYKASRLDVVEIRSAELRNHEGLIAGSHYDSLVKLGKNDLIDRVEIPYLGQMILTRPNQAQEMKIDSLMCLAVQTLNIPFICLMSQLLECDVSLYLKKALERALSFTDTVTLLENICRRLPEGKVLVAEHSLIKVLRNSNSSKDDVMTAISEVISRQQKLNPQVQSTSVVLKKRYEISRVRGYYQDNYQGILLHCVACLFSAEVFNALQQYYQAHRIAFDDERLYYQSIKQEPQNHSASCRQKLTLKDCLTHHQILSQLSILQTQQNASPPWEICNVVLIILGVLLTLIGALAVAISIGMIASLPLTAPLSAMGLKTGLGLSATGVALAGFGFFAQAFEENTQNSRMIRLQKERSTLEEMKFYVGNF